jgi:hypothetical protein
MECSMEWIGGSLVGATKTYSKDLSKATRYEGCDRGYLVEEGAPDRGKWIF